MTDSTTQTPDSLAETLRAGQVQLDAHREDYLGWLRDEAEQLRTETNEHIIEPLFALVERAASRHRAILAERDTGTELKPFLLGLRAYRTDVRESVLEPIRAWLDEHRPGTTLGEHVTASIERGLTLTATLPSEVLVREPDDLLAPDPLDPLGVRIRRVRHRSRRRWQDRRRRMGNALGRVARRTPTEAPIFSQTVPLEALIRDHVEGSWADALQSEHERIQEALAYRLAMVETAVMAWSHALLRLGTDLTGRPVTPEPPDGLLDKDGIALRAEADRLQDVLEKASEPLDFEPYTIPFDLLDGRLDDAIRRSGSLGLTLPASKSPVTEAAKLRTRTASWARWHDDVEHRIRFDASALQMRDALTAEKLDLLAKLDAEGLTPIRAAIAETQEGLATLRDEAQAVCGDDDLPDDDLRRQLEDLLNRGRVLIERRLIAPLQAAPLDAIAERLAREATASRPAVLAQLPASLTLHVPTTQRPLYPDVPSYTVEPRRIVDEGMTESFAEKLERSGEPLRQPLFRVVSEADTVLQAVVFNLEAAIDEVDTPSTDPDDADPRTNVKEFTVDGFARAAERLTTLAAPLDTPWADVQVSIRVLYNSSWKLVHQRLEAADKGSAHLLDARDQARAVLGQINRSARTSAQEGRVLAEKLLKRGRITAGQLIRAGKSAAGLQAQNERGRLDTLHALATVPKLRAGLPLVYRRLFSFEPVTDPFLLEHREAPLQSITEAYERWQEGQLASAMVITGPSGSGRTSLMTVLKRTLFGDLEPATVILTDRLTQETQFASKIADALGLDVGQDPTLEMLEALLLATPDGDRSHVCFVENLENLLLRAPSGGNFLERVAVFLSRTDGVVFWVTSMVLPAWHFLERTAPQVTALAQRIPLPDLDRAAIEAAIMKRHVRSGLPLAFEEPPDLQPLTRRRLTNAKTDEERQAILREVFFDRLFRATGGHLQLALLYWLRAIAFHKEESGGESEMLTVAPFSALDFSFIDRFDLQRTFTLKALLQHGSLTLAEHDRVVRTTRQESFLVFESLANELLIEAVRVDAQDGKSITSSAPLSSISETERYRIRPLLVNPVTESLRAKNML